MAFYQGYSLSPKHSQTKALYSIKLWQAMDSDTDGDSEAYILVSAKVNNPFPFVLRNWSSELPKLFVYPQLYKKFNRHRKLNGPSSLAVL